MKHSDFLIRARDWREGEILVEVNASPAGRMRDPQRAPLDRAAILPFLQALEQDKMSRSRLIELGQLLADALLPAVVREMLTRSLDSLEPEQGLRLRLALDDPSLAALPWEYLHLSRGGEPGLDGFLVLDRRLSIVRDEPIPLPALPLAAAPHLRQVAGFAAPEDTPPLDLDAERPSIVQALEDRAEDRARIRIEIRQRAARLLGTLTGVAAGEIDGGEIRVDQEVEVVGPGGEATGLAADRIGGGTVSTRQEVGTLEDGGSVTGVKLGRLR